jgi:hypothetical protein
MKARCAGCGRALGARSNSEAVRIAVDRELAATLGLNALQKLTEHGTLEDVSTAGQQVASEGIMATLKTPRVTLH